MADQDFFIDDTFQTNFDLNLYHMGEEHCSPSHHYGPAMRDHYLMHYVVSGKGFFAKDGQTWTVSQDMCFLIYPNEVTYYQADVNDPWHYVWIGFTGARVLQLLNASGFSPENPILTYGLKDQFNISEHVSDMLLKRTIQESSAIWQIGAVYTLLSYLIQSCELTHPHQHVKTTREIYVQKAIQFISTNYTNDISIQSVADYVGLDRSYFYSIFKELMHMSPKAFLTEQRLKKAKELMLTTSLNFYAIAYSVGYSDPFLFSKMIKTHTGLSPTMYRTIHSK